MFVLNRKVGEKLIFFVSKKFFWSRKTTIELEVIDFFDHSAWILVTSARKFILRKHVGGSVKTSRCRRAKVNITSPKSGALEGHFVSIHILGVKIELRLSPKSFQSAKIAILAPRDTVEIVRAETLSPLCGCI